MAEDKSLFILKNAILLEKRGKAFYAQVAEQSQNTAVKSFFEMMAAEEDRHIQILGEQFKAYQENKSFLPAAASEKEESGVAKTVLTQALKKEIAAAGFEAAAVAAAIAMEQKAIEVYGERAENAGDEQEKALYLWLTNWEESHLKVLIDIEKEVTEQVWFDNQFWPM